MELDSANMIVQQKFSVENSPKTPYQHNRAVDYESMTKIRSTNASPMMNLGS